MVNPNPSLATRFGAERGNRPGRNIGSRDRLSSAFLDALAEEWEKHGRDALRRCRETSPVAFVRMVASVAVRSDFPDESAWDHHEMTDAELLAIIKAGVAEIEGGGAMNGAPPPFAKAA